MLPLSMCVWLAVLLSVSLGSGGVIPADRVAVGTAEAWWGFGRVVLIAGDLDGDGVGDFIVSTPGHDNAAGSNAGLVQAFSGKDGTVIWEVPGGGPNEGLGLTVSVIGLVDGDGIPDFIVGRYGFFTTSPSPVTLISGRDGSEIWSVTVGASNVAGQIASGLGGDGNGDGIPDVVVADRGYSCAGNVAGAVFLLSGATGDVIWWSGCGRSPGDEFGTWVSPAGDVNGDGFPDVVVGAPHQQPPGQYPGSAAVLSGLDGTQIGPTLSGSAPGDDFGVSVFGPGDLDGDGYAEVMVGASQQFTASGGYARVYSGRWIATGVAPEILYELSGDGSSGLFGWSTSGGGDLNRDGVPDLLVGDAWADSENGTEVGRVFIFSGADGALLCTVTGEGAGGYFGLSIASQGDLNGDGRDDIVVGAPGAGRAFVFYSSSLDEHCARIATLVVCPDGSGDSRSIQTAIDAAPDGGVIVVCPGRYRENIKLSGRNLHVLSQEGPAVTVIEGILTGANGSVVRFEDGDTSTLEGFSITGGDADNGAGIIISYASPTVRGNWIFGNRATTEGAGIRSYRSSPIIEGNRIFGNTAARDGGGILLDWSLFWPDLVSPAIIRNNVIFCNEAGGVGGGIVFWDQTTDPSVVAINNTVWGNSAGEAGGGMFVNHSIPRVMNTIVWANNAPTGSQIHANFPGQYDPLVESCDVQGGWPGTGNLARLYRVRAEAGQSAAA